MDFIAERKCMGVPLSGVNISLGTSWILIILQNSNSPAAKTCPGVQNNKNVWKAPKWCWLVEYVIEIMSYWGCSLGHYSLRLIELPGSFHSMVPGRLLIISKCRTSTQTSLLQNHPLVWGRPHWNKNFIYSLYVGVLMWSSFYIE